MQRASIGREYIPFFFFSFLDLGAAALRVGFSLGMLDKKLLRVRGQDRPIGEMEWWRIQK